MAAAAAAAVMPHHGHTPHHGNGGYGSPRSNRVLPAENGHRPEVEHYGWHKSSDTPEHPDGSSAVPLADFRGQLGDSFSAGELPLFSKESKETGITQSVASFNMEDQHQQRGFFIKDTAFILNPNHRVYNYWWWFIVILTYWNLLQVPFNVAFPRESPVMNTLVWVVDSIFFLDILVVASTPIYVNGEPCNDRRIIAKQYLQLHFWIDLLACVPSNRIGEAIAPNNDYMRLLSLTRVLRVRKLIRLLEKMEKTITVSYTAIVLLKLMTLVMILAHMEACLFWFIGDVQEPNENWTQPFQELNDEWDQYLVSLYWAVTTYTTVGYGDISPVNKSEMTFGIIIMIINMGLTAYVLGNMTMLSTKVDQSVQDYRSNVSRIITYMKRKRIPEDLMQVTLQQLEMAQELSGETDDALDGVAPYIRNLILSCLYQPQLSSCFVLMNTSSEFINSIAHVSSMELFQPDTCILKCKERAHNFYFVLSGVLEVKDEDDNKLRSLRRGNTFGAESVFCDFPQYYSVWSKTLVKTLVVEMNNLKTICSQYQADHRLVCANLISYIEGLKPKQDFEVQEIKEATSRIKSHILSLKTDMVTKICYFASSGDVLAIKTMLQSDPEHDINTGDYDGRRPIHVAAAAGNVEMLDFLIDTCGADCNVIDNFGGTALLDAAKRGHAAAASRIRNSGGELLLQDAGCTMCTLVIGGNVEIVRLYLECGADPDAADYDMRTGLHIACAEGLIPMVKLFVKMGGSIAFKDRFGTTPLDEAEKSDKQVTVLSFLKTLLKDGCRDIDPVKLAAAESSKSFERAVTAAPAPAEAEPETTATRTPRMVVIQESGQ